MSLRNHDFAQQKFNFLLWFTSLFFFFFNHTCYTLFLDGFFQSATYGLQSSILGPPSIIFHKSPMNLLKVLAVALLNFARDLQVCHIEIFQMDLRPPSNAERDCCTAFLGIPYPTIYYMKFIYILFQFSNLVLKILVMFPTVNPLSLENCAAAF